MAIYNPSLRDFYQLSAADREVLNAITDAVPDLLEPTPLEEFDKYLDRLSRARMIELLQPNERDARRIGAAQRSGKPVVQRTVTPDAPAARPRTTTEYLEQRGETREAAVDRVLHRFGPPGGVKNYEDTPRTLPTNAPRPVTGKVVK